MKEHLWSDERPACQETQGTGEGKSQAESHHRRSGARHNDAEGAGPGKILTPDRLGDAVDLVMARFEGVREKGLQGSRAATLDAAKHTEAKEGPGGEDHRVSQSLCPHSFPSGVQACLQGSQRGGRAGQPKVTPSPPNEKQGWRCIPRRRERLAHKDSPHSVCISPCRGVSSGQWTSSSRSPQIPSPSRPSGIVDEYRKRMPAKLAWQLFGCLSLARVSRYFCSGI